MAVRLASVITCKTSIGDGQFTNELPKTTIDAIKTTMGVIKFRINPKESAIGG